jgi:hypothetical protein
MHVIILPFNEFVHTVHKLCISVRITWLRLVFKSLWHGFHLNDHIKLMIISFFPDVLVTNIWYKVNGRP